ncbi:ESCRT-I component [Nannizzia gypsea CBS 118893]|uniref:ESCRT-I component n=1 Tax=Arthroderma gypseum (strain ATCC MYA-4604 / CBS 118893) TaxID=535722 RepID=E5R1C7_ARTGP|nr:ESCRT-I component [Nannizzia gypsea CBS 118893]EFQ97678.1 ESCRT-I component [Nannizzia gypsea CBS 118893]
MAAVPQKTLEWLYRVLTSNQAYRDPNRTYSDTAQLLAQFPSFSPRTDVYTYENGASALLLHLTGTLPVHFRGALYWFPIAIWVPNTYPDASPMVYVTPTSEMLVRPGQHVSSDGKIYHHYLAHWAEARDRSTLVDFLLILKDVFAKEPPVISKDAPVRRQPVASQRTTPPAVPPLPAELTRPSPSAASTPPVQPPAPPKLPPKPSGERHQTAAERPVENVSTARSLPPPLPPLPAELQPTTHHRDGIGPESRGNQFLPQRSSSLRREVNPLSQPPPPTHPSQHQTQGFVPESQNRRPSSVQSPPVGLTPHAPQYQQAYQPSYHHQQFHSQHHNDAAMHPPQQQPVPHQHNSLPVPQREVQPQPAASNPPKKPETQDLLTSPFDLELPTQLPSSSPPPIPPNPEKDVLLQTLSRTLTQTLHANIEQSNSRIEPLNSQSRALHDAIATLRSEIAAVNAFHANLQSNTQILQQSLRRADGVIADAKSRISSPSASSSQHPAGLPAIDEVLVPPTVVGKQIYDLVTGERGIHRAIYALQSALVRGRVGIDVWAKSTRNLAREAFLKKALIRKASNGMGLAV